MNNFNANSTTSMTKTRIGSPLVVDVVVVDALVTLLMWGLGLSSPKHPLMYTH
jgi:hypothetical protein